MAAEFTRCSCACCLQSTGRRRSDGLRAGRTECWRSRSVCTLSQSLLEGWPSRSCALPGLPQASVQPAERFQHLHRIHRRTRPWHYGRCKKSLESERSTRSRPTRDDLSLFQRRLVQLRGVRRRLGGSSTVADTKPLEKQSGNNCHPNAPCENDGTGGHSWIAPLQWLCHDRRAPKPNAAGRLSSFLPLDRRRGTLLRLHPAGTGKRKGMALPNFDFPHLAVHTDLDRPAETIGLR